MVRLSIVKGYRFFLIALAIAALCLPLCAQTAGDDCRLPGSLRSSKRPNMFTPEFSQYRDAKGQSAGTNPGGEFFRESVPGDAPAGNRRSVRHGDPSATRPFQLSRHLLFTPTFWRMARCRS